MNLQCQEDKISKAQGGTPEIPHLNQKPPKDTQGSSLEVPPIQSIQNKQQQETLKKQKFL